jgi:D-serine deaminase-like pyridoxal phosphate-dependent protein
MFDIDTPALLIERSKLLENMRLMQAMANRNKVNLRVHVKSHKIPELAGMQIKAGAIGIAVSKLAEAEVMAATGIRDIQIANIIVGKEKIERLLALSRRCRLSVAVDSLANARELSAAFLKAGKILRVLVKVDTGLGRCGLDSADKVDEFVSKCRRLAGINIVGLMTHAGHAYAASSRRQIRAIGYNEGDMLVRAALSLRNRGYNIETISAGSTPTAPYCSEVEGVTELRVGNYIFNDMIQVSLGTVPLNRCALTILATIISCPTGERAVIDAGSKALGLDRGAHGLQLLRGYGRIVGGGGEINRLSEEHGIIEALTRNFRIGTTIRIIPNHACTVMNLFDHAYLVEGKAIVKRYKIAARGKMN